jgi:hypothetical protein
MNSAIETWKVQQYASNVYQLSQQKGSRLASLVRNEKFTGKAEFFDRIGTATAQKKTGRNTDTPNLDIAHSRRMVTTNMYEWATLVDRKDKLLQIHNPENEYSVAARNALGRSMDEILIEAALGVAKTGEDGSTSTYLGNAQRVASVASASLAKMNIQSLRKAKLLMDKAEVEGKRHIVINASQLEALLATTEITSADYNSVKALVQGELNTFLGFNFIRTELLPLAVQATSESFAFDTSTGLYKSNGTAITAAAQSCFAFAEGGILLGMNEGMVAKVDERSDKSYSNQVYTSMDLGGVRMEEAKVVEILSLV